MDKLEFPNRVTVELTSRCNLMCTFCNRYDTKIKIGDMTEKLYKKIIDEIAEHRPIALVPFFRGESLLHPHFVEYMKYAKKGGIGPIQLTSNGMVLTESMAEKLLDAEIDFISFSLDTLDEELYSKSRLHGKLSVSMNNVLNFIKKCEERRRQHLKTPQIQVSTIDTEDYGNGKEKFIDFWQQYADIVRVYVEHDDYGGFRNPEVRRRFSHIDRLPCKKLFTELVILFDGSLSLCCYDWDEKHQIGDVNVQSLSEIWSGEALEQIRKMSNENSFTSDYICSRCEHWKSNYIDQKYLGEIYLKRECEE